MIATGDRVTLVDVPAGLKDHRELRTRSLFEACVGHAFVVASADGELAELRVGDVLGEGDGTHTIWVEQRYLRRAN